MQEALKKLNINGIEDNLTGREIYRLAKEKYGSDKAASIAMNQAGIKGITYIGFRDGKCFVVFDDKAIRVIQKYNQRAWHGSFKTFDKFDLGAIGSGTGFTAHGWGLYFAKDKKIADSYKQRLSKKAGGNIGTVYEVEVPDDNVLLDEDKTYKNQPKAVREAIYAFMKAREDQFFVPKDADHFQDGGSGRDFYKIVQLFMAREGSDNPPRDASLLLNKLGIKGISYEGGRDGRCFVVFDDKAISVIQRYNQSQGQPQRTGAYDPAQNIIALFSGANQSTLVHETAHMWLTMLEKIAQTNEKAGADLFTIQKWAAFSEENLQEYKGTKLEKEFYGYADVLRKNPNDLAMQQRYIQERFARGFERYLATGSAPTKEMRGVFRRFKKWLLDIYKDIKNLGKADPPEDIKRIFDTMLATEEEVDAWTTQRKLDSMDMGIDFTKTEKENFDSWVENIKETIKEKCLQYFMDQTKEKALQEFDAQLEVQKDQWRQELVQQHKIYQMEITRELHPTASDWKQYLKEHGMTEESYQEALDAAGGPLETVIEAKAKAQREEYVNNILTPEMIKKTAEDVLQSPEGQTKRAAMEANALRRKINQYIRTVTLAQMELDRADETNMKQVAKDIKERLGIQFEEDIHEAEKGRLHEEAMNAKNEVAALKSKLFEINEGLKSARESFDFPRARLKQEAAEFLANEKISKATNWKWWDNKARSSAVRAMDALKKKDFATAAFEKQNEIHYSTMARIAKEYEEGIRKELHGNPKAQINMYDKDGLERFGIMGIINRIGRTEKPIRLTNHSRYFLQHMAYQLGLVNKDGIPPIDENGNPIPFSWGTLAMELNPTQAMDAAEANAVYLGDDVISPWIKNIFEGQQQTPLKNLTYNQFKDLITAMKVVYKIGRREYEGNTLGMSFDEAAESLISTEWNHKKENPFYAKNRRSMLQRIGAKLHKAVDTLTLPEILMERLGQK